MKILIHKESNECWDASKDETKAFLAMFHYLNDECSYYMDLQDELEDLEPDVIGSRQLRLYKEALSNNALSALLLCKARQKYEYEDYDILYVNEVE